MTPRHLQEHLVLAGYSPGGIDGIMGPLTRDAVRRFQAGAGLDPDGIAGPLTEAALWAPIRAALEVPAGPPPGTFREGLYLVLRRMEQAGAREIAGNRGPWVRELFELAGLGERDGLPWCGAAVTGAAVIAARWLGVEVPPLFSVGCDEIARLAKAAGVFREGIGAARMYDLVLTRTRPGDWTHVGVAVGPVSGGKVAVLAGNTSDALIERRVMTSNLDTVLLP